MFKAIIETKSHEGGLLAPFTGSSPALGSIIVRVDDGTYIGKIDAVLGSTDSPIAHIAHLDRKMNPDMFMGCEAQIRPKIDKHDGNRQRNDRYGNRDRRDNRRGNDNYNRRDPGRRDSGRGNYRDRDSGRRNSHRGNYRDRDSGRRDSRDKSRGRENKIFADNDWTCTKCNNSNFSFRKECNRCGEPKSGSSGGGNNGGRRDRQPRNDRSSRNDGEPRKFRKARGKSANHAHNRGPKPLDARSRRRNRDD